MRGASDRAALPITFSLEESPLRDRIATCFAALAVLGLLSLTGCGADGDGEEADAKAAEVAAAPAGRLPPNATPVAYQLDLVIDPREKRFGGLVTIDVRLAEQLAGLWLHGNRLDVSEVTVTGPRGDTSSGSYQQVLDSGVARIDFGRALGPGDIKLEIAYSAAFDQNLAGLFAVEEQGEHYALAKSESIQARKFLPGFDEPGLKARYDIALTVPRGYVAISNAPVVSRTPTGEDMERVTFATTRPLPTYLLSLAVGPFDVVERPDIPPNDIRAQPIPLRGVARKGRGADLGYILDITPEFVRIFEQALEQPYPYQKLDIVAAPQWPSGATELAAAITYREERVLADGTPPPGLRRSLISVHAHELAHMWFGNLVTPPWWDDLWLKEGFATWGTPLVLTEWEPDGGHDVDRAVRSLGAMATDSLASARRVREPITANEDIRSAYTSIPYSKGMALIAMADSFFGKDVFRPALGAYVARFADGAADSDDFFQAIGEATGEPALTESFRSFVEQPGVPFLKGQVVCEADAPYVELAQQRYRPVGSAIDPGVRWVIPVCATYGNGGNRQRTCALMREERMRLPLAGDACPAFVHPNAGGAGYYRWTLGAAGWATLIEHFEALSAPEALSAVDSAAAAFEAGETPAAALLAVMEAAARSDSRQVATQPLGAIEAYRAILDEEAEGALMGWAAGLYGPRLSALTQPQNEDERLLRDALLRFMALQVEAPAVRTGLAAAAAEFVGLNGPRNADALDADRYREGFTVGVQDLGRPFFEQLVATRSAIDDPQFDEASAVALGRVTDPELVEQAQALALSGQLGTRETFSLIGQLFTHPAHRNEVWAWYRENFARVLELIPEQWRRQTPEVARHFCSEDKAQETAEFFAQVGDQVPGHERQLAQTIERIRLCAALKAAHAEELAAALKSR